MANYPWREYADYVYTKWERMLLWDMLEPIKDPKLLRLLLLLILQLFTLASAVPPSLSDSSRSDYKMTTYGTIPAELPPSSNFIFHTKEQIRSGLGRRRQWKEMVKIQAISLPYNVNDSVQRMRTNAAFFRMNYVIIVLFLLFLTLLWHPLSLIVFIIMMMAWLFLYFLRDDPVSIEAFVIDDRIVMTGLLLVTIAMLFLTDVTDNIIVGLSIGLTVVLVHGIIRSTDDLVFGDEEEVIRSPVLMRPPEEAAPLPLKNAASFSYSVA